MNVGAPAERRPAPVDRPAGSPLDVLRVFGRLGLTSFGGPIAHLGYFREEIVARRRWVDEATYADLVALCQFLPGPASSQVGIGLGILRAGLFGGLAAWIGFTLPSALAMALFGLGAPFLGGAGAGAIHGLKVVAVAVVAQAVWSMARSLCPDRPRATLALVVTLAMLALPALGLPVALGQLGVIAAGGLFGWFALRAPPGEAAPRQVVPLSRGLALGCWAVFFALLVGLPLLARIAPSDGLAVFESFYRVGSLVFGGGHVILPLLWAEVVPPGWVTNEQFIAGYGAAQAIPGPLFTFSAYLGAARAAPPNGWAGALLALTAVFLPSFLLVVGALPFWEALRSRVDAQAALRGVNAAVVGLLLAALYDPIWTSTVLRPADFALALAAFGLLQLWKVPPWLVVALTALGGALIASW
jgi:chromate transporter